MNDKQFEQAKKQLHKEMNAIGCGWINGNYIKPPKEYALREEELSCINMINSILCYRLRWETNAAIVLQEDRSKKYSYLSRYIESLGEAKVIQLIQNQIDDIAYIKDSVYTDGEGLTYNSIIWKNEEATKMNFEVMCFDFINDSLTVVQKEYFDTLEEAIYFENTEGLNYAGGTSITPINEWAEKQMK